MRWAVAGVCAIAVTACGSRPPAAPTATATAARPAPAKELTGRLAEARVHVPRRHPAHPALVIAFHGLTDTGPRFARAIELEQVADREGFITAFPTAADGRRWELNRRDGSEDIYRTRQLIDEAVGQLGVDPRRVYVTGFSNGGGFTARVACELAGKVAAAVPVAGSYKAIDHCPRSGPRVALMEVHGARDPWLPTVPRLLGMWLPRDGCRSAPRRRTEGRGITHLRWPGCRVERVFLAGTEHGWPGEFPLGDDPTGYKASRAVWGFVRGYRRD
jgi:polyhydroxybutyrate depolymerase